MIVLNTGLQFLDPIAEIRYLEKLFGTGIIENSFLNLNSPLGLIEIQEVAFGLPSSSQFLSE